MGARQTAWKRTIAAGCALLLAAPAMPETGHRSPTVTHIPPRAAPRGQPMTLRAQVLPGTAPVRAVTLYGTTSRDSAPFPLRMTDAGVGAFLVVVPGHLLDGEEFTYYIEALDALEAAGETPWHTVRLHAPGTPEAPVPREAPDPAARQADRRGWVAPAIIAGGAAVAIAGVALASGGGSSGDRPPTPGRYTGSVTRILREDGAPPLVESNTMTIVIEEGGRVRSSDLHRESALEGEMAGAGFVLSADITIADMTGGVRYVGIVSGNRVTGDISGEVTGPDERRGLFSGSFSGTRP